MMMFLQIEGLLRQKIGIDVKIIGGVKIARAVETRCRVLGVGDIRHYWEILRDSPDELDELTELIVVPETWFFRDDQIYKEIANYVVSECLNNGNQMKIRLLSFPCSTGEEPYSLAMGLLDMGLSPSQFHIDGVDISQAALSKARIGIYSRNSFRGNNLKFEGSYFNSVGKDYQISARVRNLVNFSQGNLLDNQLLLNRKPYDVILCRNVLIYFDSLARQKTLKNLSSSLTSKGIILVGASETSELSNSGLEIIRLNKIFAGSKNLINQDGGDNRNIVHNIPVELKSLGKPEKNNQMLPKECQPARYRHTSIKNNQVTRKLEANDKEPGHRINNSLSQIRYLADEGNLTAATVQCQNYLQLNSTYADAYVLLGEIYQAQRLETMAEECFQKAIYLDPKNSQAMISLTLLKEQRGDITKAKVLRQRLERLQNL
jgi:chemotaxis protein methyltransferase WspC